jgi:N-Acetylglucosaminyltransferase-IV (GnT-IV) conserved region
VLTKKSFIKIMKNFALEKTAAKQNWFVIDFCQLGFIGILLWLQRYFALALKISCFGFISILLWLYRYVA